jgi:hypothetical protein
MEFESDFKKNFEFIKYFIIVDILSMSGIMIYTLTYVLAFDLNLFSFVYLFLMFVHFWWTVSSGLKARKVSKELTFKLNKWQELNVNEIS